MVKNLVSQILYELDHRKPVLYIILIENIVGKLPVIPVDDTGTIPHPCATPFQALAPSDSRPGETNGCRMWFVNSWAFWVICTVICNEWGGGTPYGERFRQCEHASSPRLLYLL